MIKIKKNVTIILGNGFSIDLIYTMKQNDKVNLSNLFYNGDKVLWPADDEPGFLSQFHCPELWTLGARPNMDQSRSAKLIEDIITCANVSASSSWSTRDNTYIKAYHELVSYLRYLFIYYNNEITDDDLNRAIDEKWGWSELFKNLNNNANITSVTFITYNYDIFLERILHLLGIEFQMLGFDTDEKKFRIIKPHGSISFRSNRVLDKDAFSIKYNRDSLGGKIDELVVDEMVNYDEISSINTMIPPSGESERYNLMWSKKLRDCVMDSVKIMQEDNDVIIGGISYCNVDRSEIDKIITNLNAKVNIKIINPDINNTFGAVISSVFEHYVHYTNSGILRRIYK